MYPENGQLATVAPLVIANSPPSRIKPNFPKDQQLPRESASYCKICDTLLPERQRRRRKRTPEPTWSAKQIDESPMPETMQELLLKYPPREIDPVEREYIDEWLAPRTRRLCGICQ